MQYRLSIDSMSLCVSTQHSTESFDRASRDPIRISNAIILQLNQCSTVGDKVNVKRHVSSSAQITQIYKIESSKF